MHDAEQDKASCTAGRPDCSTGLSLPGHPAGAHLHALALTCTHPCVFTAYVPLPQRTFAIWAFAFAFAWRYFLLGKAWSYKGGRKGMTSDAVSRRKRELAVWLREGLVKLGVSATAGCGAGRAGGCPKRRDVACMHARARVFWQACDGLCGGARHALRA
jgi:hypothetical protein